MRSDAALVARGGGDAYLVDRDCLRGIERMPGSRLTRTRWRCSPLTDSAQVLAQVALSCALSAAIDALVSQRRFRFASSVAEPGAR